MSMLTPEDLKVIDSVCDKFDWSRVTNTHSHRIGPRRYDTPISGHDPVVNAMTLAGYSLRQDPDWVSITVYFISK